MTSSLDAHIHVHSPDFTKYPLAPGFERSDLWYPSMTPDHYAGYARSFGMVRANLVQPTWYGLDHTYIIDCIASALGQYVGTGIVPAVSDVALPPPDRAMLRLSERGIRAFRIRGGSARARFGAQDKLAGLPRLRRHVRDRRKPRPGPELPHRPRRPAGDRPHVQPLPRHAGHHRPRRRHPRARRPILPPTTSSRYAASRATATSPSSSVRSTS